MLFLAFQTIIKPIIGVNNMLINKLSVKPILLLIEYNATATANNKYKIKYIIVVISGNFYMQNMCRYFYLSVA